MVAGSFATAFFWMTHWRIALVLADGCFVLTGTAAAATAEDAGHKMLSTQVDRIFWS